MEWESVIGLEVHAQLKTHSKLFSGASVQFGALANTQTAYIDAGLPGVLPVLNQKAVTMAIQFGLAINAEISTLSIFERKNYFYPDLPKGYQISQFLNPIVRNGSVTIRYADHQEKVITIARAHLEEDAGKSLHDQHSNYTGIDLNRAGTPLLEIVTTPCMYSAEEAIAYLKTLHQLVRFLGICDGNMQEGSFRVDVNFSLRPRGTLSLGVRSEIKNLNSFRFIEKAIAYEFNRHQELLESGKSPIQETRLYNPDTDSTHSMRSKEFENDYRYFPDPDLLPIEVAEQQIESIRKHLPPLPEAINQELSAISELNQEDIHFLLSSPDTYAFYKEIQALSQTPEKLIINWLKGPYTSFLHEHHHTFENPPISAKNMALLLDKVHNKSLSNNHARSVFHFLCLGEESIELIIEREGFNAKQDDAALEHMIHTIVQNFPDQVAQYKAGKEKLLAFFVGQVMKQAKEKLDPSVISELLKKYL